jgi:hypothetical protein
MNKKEMCYGLLTFPFDTDRLMLQYSLTHLIIGLYSLLSIYSLIYGWRQATILAFIPFIFDFGYYFALDFNLDFVDDQSGNFKDMPSMLNSFGQA